MQALTDAQAALLTGNTLDVTAGLEVLNLDLTVDTTYGTDGDISDDLLGGSVSRNCDAKIHGTCRLSLTIELPWGSKLVRPYMTLTDGTVSATFRCGVFMLVTPETPLGESPATYGVQGYDRVYLLDREVGADYTATAGETYYDELVAAFTAAGVTGYLIDGSAQDYTLPADRDWLLVGRSTDPDQTSSPVTWLRIVNDLLSAINFRAVWADADGRYRCQPYQRPSDRAPEFTFDTDLVGMDRVVTADQWKAPNRWVFLRSNGGTGVEGDGIYTVVNQSDGPTSIDERGLTWTKVYSYEAASQAVLESLGDRRVASDQGFTTTYKVTTGPWPVAGHWDVYEYTDADAGGTVKVMASDWEFDLTGGDVSWMWEAIV